MESVILDNLSIGYKVKGNEKLVSSDLKASVNSGELTCLLGRNGIGKSTLLRTLSAFQPAISGRISMVNGGVRLSLSDLTDRQLSRLIGVVLTEKPDVPGMTVSELVAMGRSPYTDFWGRLTEDDSTVVSESLSLVGIGSLANRLVQTLSDGERQKAMIAKALAQQTPVIYLDEPTAFLDFPSKVEMMQLLHRLAHETEKTVLLSTHDVELALQLADRLWIMEPGTLYVGTPQELATKGVLNKFIERDGISFDADTLTIKVTKR